MLEAHGMLRSNQPPNVLVIIAKRINQQQQLQQHKNGNNQAGETRAQHQITNQHPIENFEFYLFNIMHHIV